MKMKYLTLCILAGAVALSADAAVQRVRLDEGWKFKRNEWSILERDFPFERMSAWLDDMGRELMETSAPSRRPSRDPGLIHPFTKSDCKDASWRTVRVPHDWGVEDPFSCDLPPEDGCLGMTGVGWYRRMFKVDVPTNGKVFFECDGAMMFAMVWVNGHFVGGWPYGYTSWRVDLTPWLNRTGDNSLVVRVAQMSGTSRWYTGAGLNRDCYLAIMPEDHVIPGSVYITTPQVTKNSATVRVRWTMSKGGAKEKTFTVAQPRLWDVSDPHLYTVDVEGETYRYGIRTIKWTADDGFHLNGRRVHINGMCLHHDLGALGSAWNRGACKRRLLLLKEAGVNAIRMSHYRHAAGFYDLCDELGLLVMDEVFDQWEMGFNANDYHRLFADWHERDLRAWMRADRNHPCIVIWSLGNEISEQRPDMSPMDFPRFQKLGMDLLRMARQEDDTRPFTTANNGMKSWNSPYTDFVDVYGFNYRPFQFADYHALHPQKPMVSTETGCLIGTRGEYFFPLDRGWKVVDWHSSSYCLKSILPPDEEWAGQDKVSGHAGAFFWTGFDYLGGPFGTAGIRRTPSSVDPARQKAMAAEIRKYGALRGSVHSCATGLFDLAGFPRDAYWLYQSRFRPDLPSAHILPHWNWPERVGEKTPVMVFSAADEVELFLNGVSQGRRTRAPGWWRFRWDDVVYAPGELKAVAYKDGKEWATETVRTTGAAAKLDLVPEAKEIASDGESIAYVTVRVLDADGAVVPRTRTPVKIEVSGAGEFVAADNGDEADLDGFCWTERKAFNGYLSVLVRAKKNATGPIRIVVSSSDLGSVETEVLARRPDGR